MPHADEERTPRSRLAELRTEVLGTPSFSHACLHLAKYAGEACAIAEDLEHPHKRDAAREKLRRFLQERGHDLPNITRMLMSEGAEILRELEESA